MTLTADPAPQRSEAAPPERPPSLADGVELIGEYEGSGFKEPPSLVRRADGQVIQLPGLLYEVAAHADGHRSYGDIAEAVSDKIHRGLDADQIRYLAEEKLRPIGVLAAADGTSPQLEKPDPFLALKFRMGVIPERVSGILGTVFKPLFLPMVVAAVLAAFVAADVWLLAFHGVAQAVRQSILHPGLFLPMFGAVVLAAAYHEIGHAAACRYGGGRPGRMGCGLYLAWPAFYTDVTDAYRLGRRARLRTDLGGVYFNVIIVLATIGAYLLTGFEPLLLLVIIEHFEIVHQLLPVIRLDGYYIVADLTGVPDLFARIGPILRSSVPGRPADPSVRVLKRWVRVAVTAWVLIVVPLLVVELLIVLIHLPRIMGTGWQSASHLGSSAGTAFGRHDYLGSLSSGLQVVVLAIPILGILLMLWRAMTGGGRWMWRSTEGRPVLRMAGMGTALVGAAALAMAWIPSHNYKPIQPGERGTLADGAGALRHLPSSGPLYSSRRAVTTGSGTSSSHSSGSGSGTTGATTTTVVTGRYSPSGSSVTSTTLGSTSTTTYRSSGYTTTTLSSSTSGSSSGSGSTATTLGTTATTSGSTATTVP